MKKVLAVVALSLGLIPTAFAKQADWNGKFVINHDQQTITVEHTPNGVIFQDMIYTKACIKFGKGVTFNGIKFDDDVKLCTDTNVENFSTELDKLGVVVSRTIKLGPTYTTN